MSPIKAKNVWIRIFCPYYASPELPSHISDKGLICLTCEIMGECWEKAREKEIWKGRG